MRILILLIPLVFFISCKTQEQVRREQMLDNVAHQVGQGQRSQAEVSMRLGVIEKNLSLISGKMEELEHDTKQNAQSEISAIKQELTIIQKAMESKDKSLNELKNTVEEQQKYIKEVLSTLASMGDSSASKKKFKKRDEEINESQISKAPLEMALDYFHEQKYDRAKPLLIELLKNKKINGNNRAKVIHTLGMIDYLEENYEDSVVFFSRLFSEHPGSSLNSSGLLHLGLSLKHLKKKQEAKQALEECISRYPKTKSAQQAHDLLKKL